MVLKKEMVVEIGSAVFKKGFEQCLKSLFFRTDISAMDKELWVILYFKRRETSYKKGAQKIELELDMSEELFQDRLNDLLKKGFLYEKEDIIYIDFQDIKRA